MPDTQKALVGPQVKALIANGWIMKYDVFMFTMIFLSIVVGVFDMVFRGFDIVHTVAYIGIVLIFQLFWMISLIYRTMYFVLLVRADVNLLPESAAKIVLKSPFMAQNSGGE